MKKNIKTAREIFRDAYPDVDMVGKHVHHVVPRYLGGTDDIENLILVTPEEHYDIHLERGEHGACSLLSDGIDREPIMIPVASFDMYGDDRIDFESFTDAAAWLKENSDLNTSISGIGGAINMCCNYKQKSIGDRQWFYLVEVKETTFVEPTCRDESKVKDHNRSNQEWGYDKLPNITLSKNDVGRILMGEDYKDKTKRPHGTIFNNNEYFAKHFRRKQ